jgi:hypothetical protein
MHASRCCCTCTLLPAVPPPVGDGHEQTFRATRTRHHPLALVEHPDRLGERLLGLPPSVIDHSSYMHSVGARAVKMCK